MRLLQLALSVFLIAVVAQSQPSTSASGPDQLVNSGAPGPFFISAQHVTGKDGNVRWSEFDEATIFNLRGGGTQRSGKVMAAAVPAASSGPCAVAIISSSDSGPGRSLKDFVRDAEAIYRGVVSSLTPGFELGRPVTVVGIDIGKIIRAERGFPTDGRVLVIHPYADFKIGDTRFCNAASATSAPHLGDQVILFAHQPPMDSSRSFLLTPAEQLFVERDNRLIVPQYLKDPSITATTLYELERRIVSPVPSREGGRAQ